MIRSIGINKYSLSMILLLTYFELGACRSLMYPHFIIMILMWLVALILFTGTNITKNISRYDIAWFSAIAIFVIFRNQYVAIGEIDYNILYYLFIAVLIYAGKSKGNWIEKFLAYIYWISLIHAIATIVFAISPAMFSMYTSRFLTPALYSEAMSRFAQGTISGLCVNYGVNAGILAMGTGVATVYLIWSDRQNRIYKLFPVLIRLTGLLFTGKRSPVILLVVAIGIIYLFSEKRKVNSRLFKLIFMCVALLFLLLVLSSVVPQIGVLTSRLLDAEDWTTLGGRTDLYQEAYTMIEQKPILGHGWNSYKLWTEQTVGRNYVEQYARMQTHNIYLQLMAEVGILGLVVFCGLFIYPVIKSFKVIREYKMMPKSDIEIKACLYLVLFFLLYGLSGNPLYDAYIYIPTMLACGAMQYYIRSVNIDPDERRK